MTVEIAERIERTPVPASARLATFPEQVPGFRHFEPLLYDTMSQLCADYTGGYWHMYLLDNGGFYMAPDFDGTMTLTCSGNYFSGEMTPDAAGIVACLFAFSSFAWRTQNPRHGELFHLLRHYACEHDESQLILAAID